MSTDGRESVTRRGFLRAATTTTAAAGTAGTAAAQDGTTTAGGGGGPTEEVAVGPGGSLTFEPADLTIAPGTTVRWVWEGPNHNVVPSSQPEDANWQGTPGAPDETYDTGYEYTHTFQTTGTYDYYCQPHRQAGMTGTITVQEGAGEEAAAGPAIPNSAKTLSIATTAALVFTLGLAYFFMKYGGDYGDVGEQSR